MLNGTVGVVGRIGGNELNGPSCPVDITTVVIGVLKSIELELSCIGMDV